MRRLEDVELGPGWRWADCTYRGFPAEGRVDREVFFHDRPDGIAAIAYTHIGGPDAGAYVVLAGLCELKMRLLMAMPAAEAYEYVRREGVAT